MLERECGSTEEVIGVHRTVVYVQSTLRMLLANARENTKQSCHVSVGMFGLILSATVKAVFDLRVKEQIR
jgi:hypothetical protein